MSTNIVQGVMTAPATRTVQGATTLTRTLLTSGTATSVASLTFGSTVLTSAYNTYELEITGWTAATANSTAQLRASIDGGSTWLGAGSYRSDIFSSASDAAASTLHSVDNGSIAYYSLTANASYALPSSVSGNTMNAKIRMPKPYDASFHKIFKSELFGTISTGGQVATITSSGQILTLSAINAIQITSSAATITLTYNLYGIS